MLPYINNAFKLLSLVSITDIRKIMKSKDSVILDIWGDYDSFINSQSSKFSDIRMALFEYSYRNKEQDINTQNNDICHNLYIVAKIGYIKLIKNIFSTFRKTMHSRHDLNLITRMRLSLLRCLRIAHRDVFSLPIISYLKNIDKANYLIKDLFHKHKIDRIYLYKYVKNIDNNT